jgi:predicted AlkP superfamily phosphohydrolase/phosphomutase
MVTVRAPLSVHPALAAGLILVVLAAPAEAYVGPGAGFALLMSFFTLLTTAVVALVSLLILPVRLVFRLLTRRRTAKPLVRRLVIVGLDGQDPALTDRFMGEGKLPNFSWLAARGGYRRLTTTCPAVSPVAWSTFSTGVNPGRHNIFDFLDRDPRTYLPRLSSARIAPPERVLRLGRFRLPLRRPVIRLLRKSRPFWSILGEHHVWSTVLRVPITFPPDAFYGAQLSAMSAPDLLGTQGTFTLCTTREEGVRFSEGGARVALRRRGMVCEARLAGPPNVLVDGEPALSVRLSVREEGARAVVTVGTSHVTLEVGVLSDWIPVAFRAVPFVTVHGICRLQLLELGDHVSLYVTPINIDPEKPAMPISHPPYYAAYLAKRVGPYATLGLAEDTGALNEAVIDERAFLRQAYEIDAERERMLMAGLDTLRQGCLVCVFDATDRIQHMFWRHLDAAHHAGGGPDHTAHAGTIEALYRHNDALVGRVMAGLGDGDVLMVLSDHGFGPFRRGVNLNGWLLAHGYLALKPGADGSAAWLRDVDWSRTRAYALGLAGLYLNLEGREAQGIVKPGAEADSLRREVRRALTGLRDEERGTVAITEAFDAADVYNGPYRDNGPDLIVGYNAGYRISWDSATGVVCGETFSDNRKAWSGDHCFDPRLVPGVLFCSQPIEAENPGLIDIAPTVLHLFGIQAPPHMEGRVLFQAIRQPPEAGTTA